MILPKRGRHLSESRFLEHVQHEHRELRLSTRDLSVQKKHLVLLLTLLSKVPRQFAVVGGVRGALIYSRLLIGLSSRLPVCLCIHGLMGRKLRILVEKLVTIGRDEVCGFRRSRAFRWLTYSCLSEFLVGNDPSPNKSYSEAIPGVKTLFPKV